MANKQKLKDLHQRLRKWSDNKGDEELDEMLNEYLAALDDFEQNPDGSNPPNPPKNPPGVPGRG